VPKNDTIYEQGPLPVDTRCTKYASFIKIVSLNMYRTISYMHVTVVWVEKSRHIIETQFINITFKEFIVLPKMSSVSKL